MEGEIGNGFLKNDYRKKLYLLESNQRFRWLEEAQIEVEYRYMLRSEVA